MVTEYKPYKRYDVDFKRKAVALLESSGRPVAEVAGDLGIPYKTLERWKHQYRGRNLEPSSQKPPDPAALEIQQLKRKLSRVELERDILKKALAICSREANEKDASS